LDMIRMCSFSMGLHLSQTDMVEGDE
jgi:hypothetical protein